jgi:hypothetical protein
MGLKTKINHVAMSVPAAELDDVTRKELADFYGEVFGWIETVAEEEEGNPLILRMTEPTQFVYIYPEPGEAMKAPRLDHFGVEVATEAELDEVLEKARRFQDKDDRVDIIDKKVTRYGVNEEAKAAGVAGIDLVNIYIGYRLPLMVEVQHFKVVPA